MDCFFIQTRGPTLSAQSTSHAYAIGHYDPHYALTLQIADRHRGDELSRNTQHHMDVIGHCLTLDEVDAFLTTQLTNARTNLITDLSIQRLSAILGQDHHVSLAFLPHIGLTLPVFHNGSHLMKGLPQGGPSFTFRRKRQSLFKAQRQRRWIRWDLPHV